MRRAALVAVVGLAHAAAPASGQEQPLPLNAVARVGDEPILTGHFRKWLRVAALGQDPRGGVPHPPSFTRCIGAERKRLARKRRGVSRATLRRRCRRRYEALKREVMQFLVQSAWVRQEAAARGIAVARREVRRQLRSQRRQAFDTDREYRRFLRRSGMTEADLLYRVKVDLLQTRITRQVANSAPPVTSREVSDYYATHRRRFRRMPRRRARRIIRRVLRSQRERRAIDTFVLEFRARYRAVTVCREGYEIAECSHVVPAACSRMEPQRAQPHRVAGRACLSVAASNGGAA